MTYEPEHPDTYRDRPRHPDEERIQTMMLYEIAVQLSEIKSAIKQSAPP